MNLRAAIVTGVIVLGVQGVSVGATRLEDGQTVTGLYGASDSETMFEIVVPEGKTQLTIRIWGGTGDCDLLVRRNVLPTTSPWRYDYGSFGGSNSETITVSLPGAGTWYIMLYGWWAYSGVSLQAYCLPSGTIIPLENNVPVSSLSGTAGSQVYFSFEVPAGRAELEIGISGGTGDCDLYIRRGAVPTTTSWDYRPYTSGNNETVKLYNPWAGTWYIMLRGYWSYNDVTLLAWYKPEFSIDLTVDTVRFPSGSLLAGEPGQQFNTNCHICNVGTEDIPSRFSVAVYLSDDDRIDDSDYLLGTFFAGPIQAERWAWGQYSCTLPTHIPPGNYRVIHVVDAYNEITEKNESNNTGSAAGFELLRSFKATGPIPADKDTDVPQTLSLRWRAGRSATYHDVYFGDNAAAVASANTANLSVYRDRVPVGTEAYPLGPLAWGKTYYWRIDEVNPADGRSPWMGDVWSFTTANFLVVDNFEGYTDDVGNRIFETWTDGHSYKNAPQPGNGTGSRVGHMRPPFAEQSILHGGRQSMPIEYNDVSIPYHSEAERTWTSAQDWTVNGMDTLVLYVQGKETNDKDPLYVVIQDNAGRKYFAPNSDAAAASATDWLEWKVPLSKLTTAGVNVRAIQKICVGVGDRDGFLPGGTGMIYVDDIRVVRLGGSGGGGGGGPLGPER